MRIFYIGARIVGYNTLKALLNNGFEVVGCLILDDSKKNITVAHKNFDNLIKEYNIVYQKYSSLNNQEHIEFIKQLEVDVGLVIGVSNLIPNELLNIPKLGFVGMHPTLLPKGRGRAPIPWTIIKGLDISGTTLFKCDENADTGKIIAQKQYPVYYEDTCLTLGKRSDDTVIELLIKYLPKYCQGQLKLVVQDDNKATFWEKRTPKDGIIDWTKTSKSIYDWIRALTKPYPGAFSYLNGVKINIWASRESCDTRTGLPGQIIDIVPAGMLVGTGVGNIILTEFEAEDIITYNSLDIFNC